MSQKLHQSRNVKQCLHNAYEMCFLCISFFIKTKSHNHKQVYIFLLIGLTNPPKVFLSVKSIQHTIYKNTHLEETFCYRQLNMFKLKPKLFYLNLLSKAGQ